MKKVYSLLYYELDSSGYRTGALYEIGYFTSFKKAKKAMKKDIKSTSKSAMMELKEIYNENEVADFQFLLRGEIVGMYCIKDIALNTILNIQLV